MNYIPTDDISLVYSKAEPAIKEVITHILQSEGNFIGISFGGRDSKGHPLINIDWKAGQQVSVYYLLLAINVGMKRYGEVWLKSLVDQLSQMV